METNQLRGQYVNEVWRRFEDFQQWAIANWPDPQHPVSSSDFVEARKAILALGQRGGIPVERRSAAGKAGEPEPADGGAQYVDVTPAPWP